jgi:amidophosphoribosyltransferase
MRAASGLPQDDGLVKNRYVARTVHPARAGAAQARLRLKFNPLPEVVRGKRVVVVDDSIVRGQHHAPDRADAARRGRAEVHMRISAPPIRHPCHYGSTCRRARR